MQGVVVTTSHRGVFFGYLPDDDPMKSDIAHLTDVRMCVYWPSENHGVVGLASDGPKGGAKISPAAPEMVLRDVTAYMVATPEAIKAWESEPWS